MRLTVLGSGSTGNSVLICAGETRVLVLHEGRVTGEFKRSEATPEAVMACATGHARHAA